MIPVFVEPAWLERHRAEVVLVDVRWYLDGRSGERAYEQGHLPGAVYLELDDVLCEPPSDRAGRHPLASPERFAAGLGRLGIGAADTVVAYDDAGGRVAARLVWMLRSLRQPAALLDGGLSAWAGPLEQGPQPPRPRVATPARPWLESRLIGIDQVAATDAILVDARDPARFAGGPDPVDPRSGHIPGARSLPASTNVASDGRLLPEPELRARLAELGIDGGREVISYCGSGVTACHNLLVMEHLGLPPGRLYPGSWSQWSRDPARPVQTGSDPTERAQNG